MEKGKNVLSLKKGGWGAGTEIHRIDFNSQKDSGTNT